MRAAMPISARCGPGAVRRPVHRDRLSALVGDSVIGAEGVVAQIRDFAAAWAARRRLALRSGPVLLALTPRWHAATFARPSGGSPAPSTRRRSRSCIPTARPRAISTLRRGRYGFAWHDPPTRRSGRCSPVLAAIAAGTRIRRPSAPSPTCSSPGSARRAASTPSASPTSRGRPVAVREKGNRPGCRCALIARHRRLRHLPAWLRLLLRRLRPYPRRPQLPRSRSRRRDACRMTLRRSRCRFAGNRRLCAAMGRAAIARA